MLSKVELALALLDVLAGEKDHDIEGMTGLPEARCQEIADIRRRAEAEFRHEWLNSE